MKRIAAAVWLSFAVVGVGAVAAQEKLPSPFARAGAMNKNAEYLTFTNAIRSQRTVYEKSPEWAGSYYQLLSWYESYLDNHREAIALNDLDFPPPQKPDTDPAAELRGCRAVDARTAILKAATGRQVVMINEAHHIPRHRAFTLSLLKGLYARGFRYFAAEAFDERDTALEKRGHPLVTPGSYLVDPVFGELVRTAIKIGYRIVPYEELFAGSPSAAADPIAVASRRERIQAENLKARILDRDPKAKMLLHVGYGHHSEKPMTLSINGKAGEFKVMGLRFKELTGIDPLTIDQSLMYEHVREEAQNPVYQAARNAGLLKNSPTVFERPLGATWVPEKMKGTSDMVVFHPRERYRDGRATWLRLDGRRSPVKLPPLLVAAATTGCLVQAFYVGEMGDKAVPADQFEVLSGQAKALLLPKKGRFTLRVLSPSGTVLTQEELLRE